ncbi:MAG: hypothetical protein ACOYXY_03365, partial [Thermodesulfobacteriota bacterium]
GPKPSQESSPELDRSLIPIRFQTGSILLLGGTGTLSDVLGPAGTPAATGALPAWYVLVASFLFW